MEERILEKLRKEQKYEQNKLVKKFLVAIVSTAIIFGTVGVAAGSYTAKQITFRPSDSTWKVSNVSDAIDDLKFKKVSNNYSTEEQVVGTWIDGKPLYQKTIDCGALPNNKYKDTSISISDLKQIVSLTGAAHRNTDGSILPFNIYTQYWYVAAYMYNSSTIRIYTNADLSSYLHSYVTIQYTKTTDNATN